MTQRGSDEWSTATPVTTVPRKQLSGGDPPGRGVASFGGGGPEVRESVRDFARRYGWRAYALPILLVVTLVALLTAHNAPPSRTAAAPVHSDAPVVATPAEASAASEASSPPVAPTAISLKSDAAGGSANQHALTVGALPAGKSYSKVGTGTYRVLKGTSKPVGSGTTYTYDIEAENGITGVDLTGFASMVQSTLASSKGWAGHGYRLQRVSSGEINFSVSLTTSMTVRTYCGYDIPVEASCYATAGTGGLTVNRVVLNVARWVRGAGPYVGDLNAYRLYMINHEGGHALGHQHAHQCLPGGLAPVMMQQTFGLKSAATGKQCGANPWPFPTAAAGTPGAEQPDTPQNDEYFQSD